MTNAGEKILKKRGRVPSYSEQRIDGLLGLAVDEAEQFA